jgi:hypothetical protein
MSTGQFLSFNVPFKENGVFISSHTQAQAILTKVQSLIHNGAIGAAITYSANYGQTRDIAKVYAAGGWDTQINGANQAAVMHAMEQMLGTTYTALQGKIHIAPITTMDGYPPTNPWNDTVLMNIVTQDLATIETYLKNGWVVLGWQNQDTVNNPKHPYAVGGGVMTSLPTAVSDKIQQTLIGFANSYK